MMTVAAVIVAGGSGSRVGGEVPKQYQMAGGRPLIWWTLRAFADHPEIDIVQPVIGPGHEALFAAASDGLRLAPPVPGGRTRQESCRAGLEAVAARVPRKVLIHDAARPFASRELITAVLAALDSHRAVIPGMPLAETLKFAPGGIVQKTIDRTSMWTAQTPQGFVFEAILAGHRDAARDGVDTLTDDAAVAERAGIETAMVPGSLENRKVTTTEDLQAADRMLMARQAPHLPDIRVGQGIDIHPFTEGSSVVLCGVDIAHSHKLAGHSDADVVLHAVTDALFGAVGEGDIGVHFPPSDMRWKGAASKIFVTRAVEAVRQRGGLIANVDIAILAEAPRIAPHIPAMKAVLGPLLGLHASRIAIKATTMEKLGAIGRREGIMASAIATVRLP